MKLEKKTLLLFFIILILATNSIYSSVTIDSKIIKANIYSNTTEVIRQANVKVKPGNNNILIKGIPSYGINPKSIEARPKGDYQILSYSNSKNYVDKFSFNSDINKLNNKIEKTKDSISITSVEIDIIDHQIRVLSNKMSINFKNQAITKEEYEKLFLYNSKEYRKAKIKKRIFKTKKIKLEEKLKKLEKEKLEASDNRSSNYTYTIFITIFSKKEQTINLDIKYNLNNTYWIPSYDFILDTENAKLKLVYKADIVQKTGENWENIDLILSSANPSYYNNLPELYPYFLKNLQYRNKAAYLNKSANTMSMNFKVPEEIISSLADDVEISVEENIFEENSLDFLFKIKSVKNIKSSKKPTTIIVKEKNIDIKLKYLTIPKVSENCFIYGVIKNWEKLNLITNSKYSIYSENKFMGSSFLDLTKNQNGLKMFLGIEKRVLISRKKINSINKPSGLVSNRIVAKDWKIEIKNTMSKPIELLIKDQFPISSDTKIKVDLTNISNGKTDAEKGFVSWNIKLDPLEEKKITFGYNVKFPSDYNLRLE